MMMRKKFLACWVAAALLCGCNTTRSYKILSFFFDGVPEPGKKAAVEAGVKAGRKSEVETVAMTASRYKEHGPYAAKQCQGCHLRATNNLILPVEELCFQCHSIDVRKKYIHGPLASGGCKICHEPHGSTYPFLLVSEPKDFCLHCHDKNVLARRDVHRGKEAQCTECHDAHSSNAEHLLK